MSLIVGGVFGGLTVSVNGSLAVRLPSLTVTVITALPLWPAAGVTVTVRLAPLPPKTMFALGTRVVFPELPLTVRLPGAVSTSPTVKLDRQVTRPYSSHGQTTYAVFGLSFTA